METSIQKLIDISRKYGADSRFVIAGGGNTSFKTADRLWVKASGHALATIGEDGFAVLDRAKLNPMGEKEYSADVAEREAQVKDDLAMACITKDRRPSVETSLHNCMGFAYVVHLHPTLVNGLMCSNDAAQTCTGLYGSRPTRPSGAGSPRSSSCRTTASSSRPTRRRRLTGSMPT